MEPVSTAAAVKTVGIIISAVKQVPGIIKQLKELRECIKGKGEVFEKGKNLLEKIEDDLATILNALNKNERKEGYEAYLVKFNDYLIRLVKEINTMVDSKDWKSKASHFFSKSSHLQTLNAFSAELERMKLTLNLAVTGQIETNVEAIYKQLADAREDIKLGFEDLATRKTDRPTTKMTAFQKGSNPKGNVNLNQVGSSGGNYSIPEGLSKADRDFFMEVMRHSDKQVADLSKERDIDMVMFEDGAEPPGQITASQTGISGPVFDIGKREIAPALLHAFSPDSSSNTLPSSGVSSSGPSTSSNTSSSQSQYKSFSSLCRQIAAVLNRCGPEDRVFREKVFGQLQPFEFRTDTSLSEKERNHLTELLDSVQYCFPESPQVVTSPKT